MPCSPLAHPVFRVLVLPFRLQLSKEHLQKGYAVLKELSDTLARDRPSMGELTRLSDAFYTLIPHSWGRRVPEVISTKERVKHQLDLLQSLGDIEVAMRLLSSSEETDEEGDLHPIDAHYQQLKCRIQPVDHDCDTMRLIRAYVKETHGQTHTAFGLEVEDAFELEREGEAERFQPHADNPNRMLLWHGSRLSNFAGITSQGLRIAPPEAPASGWMFGKSDSSLIAHHTSTRAAHPHATPLTHCSSLCCVCVLQGSGQQNSSSPPPCARESPFTVHSHLLCVCTLRAQYFADMVSKSAQYCFTNRQEPTACMLLCEVALGGMNELLHANSNAAQLPQGKQSTKGVGRIIPDASKWQKLPNGCTVPCGPPIQANSNQCTLLYNGQRQHSRPLPLSQAAPLARVTSLPSTSSHSVLLCVCAAHAEYIVYDVSQVHMRYLLKMRFRY